MAHMAYNKFKACECADQTEYPSQDVEFYGWGMDGAGAKYARRKRCHRDWMLLCVCFLHRTALA